MMMIIFWIYILILTMTTMTGCVGAAEIKRYDEEFADAPGPSGYALVKYSDQLYAMTDDGSYKEIFGLVIRRMSAKQPITGVLAPIPIFRQIAKMMARSVLGGTFAPDPYDDSTDGKWGKIDAERWNNFYKWVNENDLVEGKVPLDTAFTNEYLPK